MSGLKDYVSETDGECEDEFKGIAHFNLFYLTKIFTLFDALTSIDIKIYQLLIPDEVEKSEAARKRRERKLSNCSSTNLSFTSQTKTGRTRKLSFTEVISKELDSR